MMDSVPERERNKRTGVYRIQVAWYAGCIMEAVEGNSSQEESEKWLTQIGQCMNRLGVDTEDVADVIIKTWERREEGRESVRAVFRRALGELGAPTS